MNIVIGDVDISDRCDQRSVKISRSQGEKSTCRLTMYARRDPVDVGPHTHILQFDNGGLWTFESGNVFELDEKSLADVVMRLGDIRVSLLNTATIKYLNDRVVFGGYVWKATRTPLKNDLQDANVQVVLTGYETSLRNQFIEDPIEVGGTLESAVTDIFDANPVPGLTIGDIPDVLIEDITFRDITIYRALQQLATAYDFSIAVDTSNTLKFGPASIARPVLLCDADAYQEASEDDYVRVLVSSITLDTTASNYANRVTLRSSDINGLPLQASNDDTREQAERGIVSRSIDVPGPYTQNTLNALAASLIHPYSRHPVRFNVSTVLLNQNDDDILLSLTPGDTVQMELAGAVNTLSGLPPELFIENLSIDFSKYGPDGIYKVNMTLSSQILNPIYSDAWRRDA